MLFLRYLKDEMYVRTLTKVNLIIDDSKNKILDQKNLDIKTYIEDNNSIYELNIGFTPQVIFQEYSLYINSISTLFEKNAMSFTLSRDYSILSLTIPEASSDILSYGLDRINNHIETFNKNYLTEALEVLQKDFEFNSYIESSEVH
jgi:hypothetical protein